MTFSQILDDDLTNSTSFRAVINQKKQEIGIKFTITGCSNFDK